MPDMTTIIYFVNEQALDPSIILTVTLMGDTPLVHGHGYEVDEGTAALLLETGDWAAQTPLTPMVIRPDGTVGEEQTNA